MFIEEKNIVIIDKMLFENKKFFTKILYNHKKKEITIENGYGKNW